MSGDVLEAIDSAICDWETGPDAVRFNAPAGTSDPGPEEAAMLALVEISRRLNEHLRTRVIPAVNRLARRFDSLTPEQREVILTHAKSRAAVSS